MGKMSIWAVHEIEYCKCGKGMIQLSSGEWLCLKCDKEKFEEICIKNIGQRIIT